MEWFMIILYYDFEFFSSGFPCFHNKSKKSGNFKILSGCYLPNTYMYINMSLFQVQSSVGSVRIERSLFYITGSGCVWATCRSKMQRLLAFSVFTVGLYGFRKYLISSFNVISYNKAMMVVSIQEHGVNKIKEWKI